jgi:hypothetical protein
VLTREHVSDSERQMAHARITVVQGVIDSFLRASLAGIRCNTVLRIKNR